MIQLTGERTYAFAQEKIFTVFSDLNQLIHLLPDVDKVKSVTDSKAELTIRPKLAFVNGHMDLTAEKTGATPPSSCTMLLTAKAIGSQSKVEAAFQLTPIDADNTKMNWTAKVIEMTGLLKLAPTGLIQGAAKTVIEDLLTRLDTHLKK